MTRVMRCPECGDEEFVVEVSDTVSYVSIAVLSDEGETLLDDNTRTYWDSSIPTGLLCENCGAEEAYIMGKTQQEVCLRWSRPATEKEEEHPLRKYGKPATED